MIGDTWLSAGGQVVRKGLSATTVALIGDSTLLGSGESSLRAALAPSFPDGIFFYARVGKPIQLADDLGYSALDNMAQARTELGREPDLWLMNLGSNGHQNPQATQQGWINAVINSTPSPVVWVGLSQANGYDDGTSSVATRMAWNAVAKPTVLAHTNGIWADWHTHIKARQGGDADLWAADGIHMTTAGYAFKSAFLSASVIAAKQGATLPSMSTQAAGTPAFSTLNYTPPTTNVRYVSPTGDDGNPGTIASPMKTLVAAANAIKVSGTAANPATVVMRAGSYPISTYNPGSGYVLRFQAYPGEEAWIDGSEPFVGAWNNNGNGTWTTSYTAPPIPPLGTDIIEGDPNAILPDMCFYDDISLYQTADNSTPTSGQFSVNRGANTLTVAQNPTGHAMRYANLVMALYTGSRIDLLGIGVRRFRCAGGLLNTGLYFGGQVPGTTIENCRFIQMGRNIIQMDTKHNRISSCTFSEVGQTSIGANKADYITIENCIFFDSNRGKWRAQPTSGVIKLVALRGSVIRYNHIKHNHTAIMIWWDVSCTEVRCYGNFIDGISKDGTTNGDTGIFYESSDGGIWDGVQCWSYIMANTVINCYRGIAVIAAGYAVVANNTINSKRASTGAPHGISIDQDRDDNHGVQVPAANCPWWSRGNRILNNRIMPQSGGWQFLAFDTLEYTPTGSPSGTRSRCIARGFGDSDGRQKGGYMVDQVESNWFAPATGDPSRNQGSVLGLIGRYNGTRIAYNSPAAMRINDNEVGLSTAVIKVNYQSAAEPVGDDHLTAVPMEAAWAGPIGLSTGTKWIGNPLPELVVLS